ncbi:MAG: NAD(P)H-hydrate dehydratase [Lachnospiraceae bacterium]|nr:NAD(P)H-hydrate dehydratase [Lachnospiraceae bacterium]
MGERFGNRVVTAEQMKSFESSFIANHGISSALLMEHAALAVVKEAGNAKRVLILVGAGKNGGDAVAAGRLLLGHGVSCDFMTFYFDQNCRELTEQWELLQSYGFPYEVYNHTANLPEYGKYDLIIDGIFGIGLNRNVSGEIKHVFDRINRLANRPRVLAIDMPSGVDATCGKVLGSALRADVTVTFSYRKSGLLLYPGRKYAGKVIVAEIGLPEIDDNPEYVTFDSVSDCRIPERRPDGNKGSFGKISLVAGCDSMPGAATFAAKAMYRSGAGLVRVISTKGALNVLHVNCPEAVSVTREEVYPLDNPFEGFDDVIVIGPGLGTDTEAERLLDIAIQYGKRLVIDADALNILAARLDRMSKDPEHRLNLLNDWLPDDTIITPHPGEMSRLLNISVAELKEDPLVLAKMIRKYCEFVWVWKDACSMVIGRNGFYLNHSGNEAMATAGSGDVLAGVCGAMAATDLTMEQAASTAVFIHGLAGDYCRERLGSYGTMAGDIADAVGMVLK